MGYWDKYGGSIPQRTAGGQVRRSANPLVATNEPQFFDPRLRGIEPGMPLSGARPGAKPGLGAARHAVTNGDPYDIIARKERELGRRMPAPYQTASAMAGQLPMPADRYQSQYENLHSERAIAVAPSMAGRRSTQWGTVGADVAQEIQWSERQKFGFGEMGSRGGGYSDEWDTRVNRERRSGKLTMETRFSQSVNPAYPFLHLVAKGIVTRAGDGTRFDGNAHLRVTAGLSETGGAEVSREFFVGGGFTGQFDMNGWDQVTIDVVDLLEGTNVQFAWVTNGLQAGEQSLYLPQRIDPTGPAVPVPEGAYAVAIEDPSLAIAGTTLSITWITAEAAAGGGDVSFTVEIDDGVSGTINQFGTPLRVLGTTLNIAGVTPVDVVWFLRSI